MARARARTEKDTPRRLPRGRHALTPKEVQEDQRRRLVEAVPRVVAARGYEAMSVADVVKAAGVSRNAFYDNFGSKQECFAAAHEACHERLLEVLEARCDTGSSTEERVETALGAGLAMLAAEPEVVRLLFVEAPGAGREIALRHHEWLRRYGALLRSAVPQAAERSNLAGETDQVIVGGIASRVAGEVLQNRTKQLRLLTPHLVEYVLAFYAAPGAELPAVAEAEAGAHGVTADVRRRRIA
jgi:AcrR family transcriptional regulator